MSFTSLLAEQQSRIDTARDRYRECNRKFSHLVEQVLVVDAWDAYAMAQLNKELEKAAASRDEAMNGWDSAIAAYADIPETDKQRDTATMAEWEEAVSLMPKGYRVKNGWFHDTKGRCNTPNTALTQRQIDILTGVISIC